MGCSFDRDGQDLDDDEESSCSEDEDDDVPECTETTAPKGVVLAARMNDDLPVFEGLDADQGAPKIPVSSCSMETQSMEDDRPNSPPASSMGSACTPIAPGPSIWLLQALKVAQQAATS